MIKSVLRLAESIRSWARNRKTVSADKVSRVFKFRYACFKDLLASNTELLTIISDIENKLSGQDVFGMSYVRSQATRAVFHTLRMVKSLDDLSGHRYPALFNRVAQINDVIEQELAKTREVTVPDLVLPYSKVTKETVDWVGGKNANLGELLNKVRLPVPLGFAITTRGYRFFLEENQLEEEIAGLKMNVDSDDPQSIETVSEKIQRLMITAPVPESLEKAILEAYESIADQYGRSSGTVGRIPPKVALRSSAIGEDSELSYAGQYLSVLNVPPEKIIETYKYILASLFTPRAISYRLNKGLRDDDVAMSVACIVMVESVASGVAYSVDPSQVPADRILINGIWGLGPYAMDDVITPDSFVVAKDDGFPIIEQKVAQKAVKLVAIAQGGLQEFPVEPELQSRPCLTSDQVRTLASHVLALERHYSYPQDVEWALDPRGQILILQARPLHLEKIELKRPELVGDHALMVEGGVVAYPGVGYGTAFHINSDEDLARFPDQGVLVAGHSKPQFVIVMRKAQAIVTDVGSITGHMASLAREFGVPTILNTKTATKSIPHGAEVTVDAYSARVYEGCVPELMDLRTQRTAAMKDTPIFETLRSVASWIVPLKLVNPTAANFAPEYCETLHDVMRFVHELSYREMFHISDVVSDTEGGGSVQLRAPIPLDLHIIDLGGGLSGVSGYSRTVTADQVASIPFRAVLAGMMDERLRSAGPRAIDMGGFLSVVREQMFTPGSMEERFGDKSYAIVSDYYVNFSSRIGYHYSVLDSYCCDAMNKNYITFAFKGGAADEIRRNRRVRAISNIFRAHDFTVEVREDRVDARYYKFDQASTMEKLEMLGRLLQFTRQMDMLMHSESSVELVTKCFLNGDYDLCGNP
ncbi:MAG: PEP/pyruvate-binding domain-containing protein [Desulfomonilaceae bacterium]|nr:PEP/pyruvate-binding domain-containing protein [Desulfomonilaceae bacterium]